MAFGSFEHDDDAPLAEINMVPLIDVMLVLLIIFMVTAPLLNHAVKVELPRAQSQIDPSPPQRVQVAIDAGGQVFWNAQAVDAAALAARIQETAARAPQTELQLHADQRVPYRHVAELMSLAARHGLTRIGFVTDPQPAG